MEQDPLKSSSKKERGCSLIPKKTKKLQEAAIALALSGQLVFSVLVGLYLGEYIGLRYDWQPFGSLAGAIIGFFVGTVSFVRLNQIMKK